MKNLKLYVGLGILVLVAAGLILTYRAGWMIPEATNREPSSGIPKSMAESAVVLQNSVPEAVLPSVPDIAIGDSYKKIVGMLGHETDHDLSVGLYNWNRDGYSLEVGLVHGHVDGIVLTVKKGARVRSPDGIVLGRDTLAVVRQEIKEKSLDCVEDYTEPEGGQILKISCNKVPEKYTVTYSWWLVGVTGRDQAIVTSYSTEPLRTSKPSTPAQSEPE